jgi:general secretion pathway protein N
MSFSLHTSPLTRATRTPWMWAMTGVVAGGALALVCFAPARWLTQSLEAASNARLSFSDVRGSVWQGSAQLSLTGGPGSSDARALPGRVGWNINTDFNGLRPGLALVVQAPCCMLYANPHVVAGHARSAGHAFAMGRPRLGLACLLA